MITCNLLFSYNLQLDHIDYLKLRKILIMFMTLCMHLLSIYITVGSYVLCFIRSSGGEHMGKPYALPTCPAHETHGRCTYDFSQYCSLRLQYWYTFRGVLHAINEAHPVQTVQIPKFSITYSLYI